MATLSAINNEPAGGASAAKVDMKFEVVVIPVTDVDRSKAFYTKLGWRLDADFERRDKKLPEVARLVGYESDAAFSKAFKRVVGANPGEYLRRGLKDPKSTEADHDQSR